MIKLRFTLNGHAVAAWAEAHTLLLDLVREELNLTGSKEGCGKGECGACTVLVDGRAVNACLYPAMEIEGREVVTIEGLAGENGQLSSVQEAFVERGGIQCGFCSPGMIMTVEGLLNKNAQPQDGEICRELAGNLCRCTGYVQILESVHRAAELRRKEGDS